MTDEQRVEVAEEKKCECKCHNVLCKFLLKVSAVFIGTLLAILVASALLRPPVAPCNCPCKMMKHQPRFEKQIPHQGMQKRHFEARKFEKKDLGHRPDFNKGDRPVPVKK